MVKETENNFKELLKRYKGAYGIEAYNFAYESLDYTIKHLRKGKKSQHVTTRELAEGCRLYAINQYGLLAKQVLNHWNIKTTRDIGEIVFQLMEFDLLGKAIDDKKENFNNLYDFNKAFNLKLECEYLHERDKWIIKYKPINN